MTPIRLWLRPTVLVGAVSAVVGVMLIVAPSTLSAVRGVFGRPAAPHVSANGAIAPDTPIPTLTAGQRGAAKTLLARDPALKAIVRADRYTIARMGSWTGERGQLLGAAAVLKLATPLHGLRAWPLMRYDHTEKTTPPYRTRAEQLVVRNATEIDTLVDLRTGRVVSLQPGGDGVRVAPGRDVASLRPAGDN
jgi:hypothetical protein